MTPPRSAFGGPPRSLSPSRGRPQRPGKAGSAAAREWIVGVATLLAATAAFSQSTPAGLWRNADDKTGEALAEIRIVDSADGLRGKIERILKPSDQPLCVECTDDRKNQPKLGMEIIRGGRKAADEEAWTGGKILDPENGREYTLRLVPLEGGKKLQVRGYLGPFYRTQVWTRLP